MKTTTLLMAATAALTLGATAAPAQVWMPIIERQAILNDRIDAGLAAGEITSAEARMIRDDVGALVALEGRYRYGGLSARERLDLDRQYALVDDQVRLAFRAEPEERLASVAERALDLEARIDDGVRSGFITTAEADRLRGDFDEIARVEASYRVDGLSLAERDDLDRRYDQLATDIRVARNDSDRIYGLNRY